MEPPGEVTAPCFQRSLGNSSWGWGNLRGLWISGVGSGEGTRKGLEGAEPLWGGVLVEAWSGAGPSSSLPMTKLLCSLVFLTGNVRQNACPAVLWGHHGLGLGSLLCAGLWRSRTLDAAGGKQPDRNTEAGRQLGLHFPPPQEGIPWG